MKKLLLIFSVSIGLATSAIAQLPNYVPTNGLVGWWPFNGNTNDESGNSLNGTIVGTPISTQDRFNIANKAYSFDGIDDYIAVTRLYQSAFSLSIWFNPSISPQYNPLVDAFDANWEVQLNNSSPDYVSFISTNNYQEFISTQTTTTNNWFHLVCTFSSNILTFYLNGIQTDQFTVNSLPNNNGYYYFGASLTGADQYYNGKIDDIGIWNRPLTQSEVNALYSSCLINVSIQPNSQTIAVNNSAQFIVNSSIPNSSYQWQTDLGVGFQNLNNVGQYSGVNDDTLNVSNVTLNNNNQNFRCIINSGSCLDTSNVAVLSVSNNVGIFEPEVERLFSVYPNPFQNIINIETNTKLIGFEYSIIDVNGRKISRGEIVSENTPIKIDNLLSGVYLLFIGGHYNQSIKIIKE